MEKYWGQIKKIFDEIKECRVFEILRSRKERGNYMVTQQAKVIAMTSTHAAIKRDQLIEIGFEYDTVIFEESG